jgi:hypothetical protein
MLSNLTPLGHCSAQVRALLKIDEERALAKQIKVRRPKKDEERSKEHGGGRWRTDADLKVPGPFWHRPVSPEGRVSFHFGWTTVAKSSTGNSIVTDSRGRTSETDRKPSDHDKYIARPDAVMTIGPAEYDQYAAKEGATDLSTGCKEVALMSNISLDPAVRANFWDAVHTSARKAGQDRLILDPTRGSKREWRDLAAAPDVPDEIKVIAADFVSGKRTRKAELPMTESGAKVFIELICRLIPRADRKKGPVRFARARNGRTQYRLETELPDGIDDAARVRIMARVAQEVQATGAMYTIVVHEPDEHNDRRNSHLHLVAHDRPAKLIDGRWDFTIGTAVEGQSGRVRFEKRSKKVTIAGLKTATNRGDFEAFLRGLRGRFAEICNEELSKAGQTRLFDPRSYQAMGIDRAPTKPLGTRLAPLEAAGVPTHVGISNAEIIWTHELQTQLRRCQEDSEKRHTELDILEKRVGGVAPQDPPTAAAAVVLASARRASSVLDTLEPELAEYDVMLAMARARPAKVLDTCSRILAEIEAGRGSSNDRKNQHLIARRRDEATAFLAEIDRVDRNSQKVIAEEKRKVAEARLNFAGAIELRGGVPTRAAQPPNTAVSEGPVAPPICDTAAIKAAPHRSTPALPALEAKGVEVEVPGPTRVDPVPELPAAPPTLEDVIARIKHDRLVVAGEELHDGQGYRVAGISREELSILRFPDIYERAQEELERIAEFQAREIKLGILWYKSYGRERAERIATSQVGRPDDNNPLGVLLAYQNHPRVAKFLASPQATEEEPQVPKQSIWRRMRESVANTLSRPEAPVMLSEDMFPDLTPAPDGPAVVQAVTEPTAVVAAAAVPAQSGRTQPVNGREEGIRMLAEVIRSYPEVRFLLEGGTVRVQQESLEQYKFSLNAFEEEPAVQAAIQARWAEEREKQRQEAAAVREQASKRAEILESLQAGSLVARKTDGKWILAGSKGGIRFPADALADDPALSRAFADSAHRALLAECSRLPVSEKAGTEAAPEKAVSRANEDDRSSPPELASPGGYTVEQLAWIQQRGRGRG